MGRTPDRAQGTRFESKLSFEDNAAVGAPGELAYNGVDFEMQDSTGVFNPRSGGGGITESQHKTLANLIHFIYDGGPGEGFVNGPFTRTITGGSFPTLEEWTDSLTVKIASKAWDRTTGGATNVKPTPITWRVYNADGVTGFEAVDVVTYSGVNETSRVRTIAAF